MSIHHERLATALALGAALLFSLPLAGARAQVAADVVCNKCVNTTDIANEAVTFRKIKPGSVGNSRIADEAITWDKIKPGNVGTGRLANGAVTEPKLADGAVTMPKLASLSVGTANIKNAAVTTPKLASLSVGTANIKNAAVTTPKLADGAVTAFKLAAGSVTAAALAAGSVTAAALAPGLRGATQSDHALFTSGGGDTAIFCGVELDEFVEPWTLHITGSAPSTKGTFTITFNDADSITFAVAAESSLSITQSMGGVGGVTNGTVSTFGADDLVKIEAADGVTVMMASASARDQATDPFDETFGAGAGSGAAEPDNFCITAPDDPGVDWADANFPEN